MKITLSQFAGFCDGVKRAFETVSALDMEKVKKPVFVLGSLVHNQDVVNKIEEKGIKKIDMEKFASSKPGEIGTLIITAHGIGPEIYKIARDKNIDVIDTTCPNVIKVQRLAQSFAKKGYKILLAGDKDHKEVKSIYEWGGGQAVIVSNMEEVKQADFAPDDKIIVLSQTTQNKDFLEKAHAYIKNKYKNAEISDTICLSTQHRQGELKKLAEENDAMVIIGSPESANSTRLYEISKSINPKSVFIARVGELPEKFFQGVKTAGVTAGASTPEWIIAEVIEYMNQF
jgi:4-hydroxy-3-methylbut-2-enyl diphosphate reductase